MSKRNLESSNPASSSGVVEGDQSSSVQQPLVFNPRVTIVHPTIPSSLGLLTRNFLDLWALSPDGCINLDFAAKKLNVPKRRIFGITNILEGIGLTEKCARNEMKWLGDPLTTPEWDRSSLEALEKDLRQVQCQEKLMNSKIAFMRESILRANQMEAFSKDCFLVPSDLKRIQELKDCHIFSVKGSPNVSFIVSKKTDASPNKILIDGHDVDLDVCMLNTTTSTSRKKRKCVESNDEKCTPQAENEIIPDADAHHQNSSLQDLDLGDIHALCQEEEQVQSVHQEQNH